MDPIRLGIVEDEARFGAVLAGRLLEAGVPADLHEDAARLLSRLRSNPPSLVVVADGARRGAGTAAALDTVRRIRTVSRIPCVVVGEEPDAERGVGLLEAGADDLMPRGTPVTTMIARMRAVLRRGAWGMPPHLAAQAAAAASDAPDGGDPASAPPVWRLLRQRRELRRPDGAECRLTTAEFDLFALLVDRGPDPVSREAICRGVFRRRWYAEDRTVDNLVVRLRRKLDDAARSTIRTVQGRGYAYLGFGDTTLREH